MGAAGTARRSRATILTRSAQVTQELIALAEEVRTARRCPEDEGLSQDEIAFYDALAESQSAVESMGNDSLKLIAHELLVSLKGSASGLVSP